MNAKLIGFAVALALIGSTNVFAGQPFGRDSVYVTPGTTTYSSKSSAAAGTIRPGAEQRLRQRCASAARPVDGRDRGRGEARPRVRRDEDCPSPSSSSCTPG